MQAGIFIWIPILKNSQNRTKNIQVIVLTSGKMLWFIDTFKIMNIATRFHLIKCTNFHFNNNVINIGKITNFIWQGKTTDHGDSVILYLEPFWNHTEQSSRKHAMMSAKCLFSQFKWQSTIWLQSKCSSCKQHFHQYFDISRISMTFLKFQLLWSPWFF